MSPTDPTSKSGLQNSSRRDFLMRGACLTALGCSGAAMPGCVQLSDSEYLPDRVWGRSGLSDGMMKKPRAMVISPKDELYIVDKSGRIHVFDPNAADLGKALNNKPPRGAFLRSWNTPLIKQGKPTGLGWSNENQLMVADTHYYRVLFYDPDGARDETKVIGGEFGDAAGQFHFVTDVVQDQRGHYFVGQYGQIDRIQEFDSERKFIRMWGAQGAGPSEFSRPQALRIDEEGLLWVADACNHRIQVFDVRSKAPEPNLVKIWGKPGNEVGALKTPYGMDFDQDGTLLIAEFGNHRIQRFSREGEVLECWGGPGVASGQYQDPWALALDSKRNIHVLDTGNCRVQRYRPNSTYRLPKEKSQTS